MTDYVSFFLNAQGGIVSLDCIEIAHSSFPKVFRYVRNDTSGITVKHEDGFDYFYEFQQMEIGRKNITNDLDQVFSITLADYDDALIQAYANLTDNIPPTFKYRIYRDDDLSGPMQIIQTLDIVSMNKDGTGLVTFDAQAPELNSVRTGDSYSMERFPMLRGTL